MQIEIIIRLSVIPFQQLPHDFVTRIFVYDFTVSSVCDNKTLFYRPLPLFHSLLRISIQEDRPQKKKHSMYMDDLLQ